MSFGQSFSGVIAHKSWPMSKFLRQMGDEKHTCFPENGWTDNNFAWNHYQLEPLGYASLLDISQSLTLLDGQLDSLAKPQNVCNLSHPVTCPVCCYPVLLSAILFTYPECLSSTVRGLRSREHCSSCFDVLSSIRSTSRCGVERGGTQRETVHGMDL